MKNLFVLLILFAAATCAADAQIAAGGNYTLAQSVVASGGGTSAGGTFKVEGTAGQAAAGTRQFNAAYNFYSGFWTAPPSFVPTAAGVAVSGRVLTTNGIGIRNVQVTLAGANGETRTVLSTKFGRFRFNDVAVGDVYIFSVSARRYAFSQPSQVRSIIAETDDLVFTADFREILIEGF